MCWSKSRRFLIKISIFCQNIKKLLNISKFLAKIKNILFKIQKMLVKIAKILDKISQRLSHLSLVSITLISQTRVKNFPCGSNFFECSVLLMLLVLWKPVCKACSKSAYPPPPPPPPPPPVLVYFCVRFSVYDLFLVDTI